MKYFIFKNPEGKFLNTGYPSSFRHGRWRDEPRLYKSLGGVRSALGYGVTSPAFEKVIGPAPVKTGDHWRPSDYEAWRAYYPKVSAIKTADYFALFAEDGYEIIEHHVKV